MSSENVVICAFGDDTPVERGRAFPEVHGGPEGAYEKDRSTGRWRSVSRGGTVRRRGSKEATDPRIVPGTRRAFDEALDYKGSAALTEEALQKEADDIDVDPEQAEEAAALRQQAAAARAETQRLWQALADVVSDATQITQLRRDGQMSRLQAEADFESQRRDAIWQLLKEGLDMATFTALTRKATGCEGEKALSIGAGVRLFEKASEPAQEAGGYSGNCAARAATPSKLRRSASRSSLSSGRASSNTRGRDATAPNMSLPGAFAFGNKGKLGMEQLKKDMKDTQVGKEMAPGPAAQKGGLTRSDSVVKMRVRDFEPKAANGGA